MPLVIQDRVRETTTTTGTGNITLLGAVTGFQPFSTAMAVSDTTYYTIAGQGTNEWEVGIGTLVNSTTLARTTVLDTSNNDANLVNFSAGAKDVFITYPAKKAVAKDMMGGTAGMLSWNPAGDGTFTPRTISSGVTSNTGISATTSVTNGNGASGNPTVNYAITNTGIVRANSRTQTLQFNTWQKPQYWNIYGEGYGYSPWTNAGTTNNGSLFTLQKGGGFNNTDTPDNYYWDRNAQTSDAANYNYWTVVNFPRASTDRNNFLRNYYYIGDQTNGGRWYQRELLHMAETNWPTTARNVRSLSELVLGLNYVDPKQAAAYQRMTNAVEQGVTPEFQADIHRKLMNANSREELDEIIRQSGL